MKIEKAISRVAWRFKQKKCNYDDDVQALNTIITFVNKSRESSLRNNDAFAKLFIEKFMMLAETQHNTAQDCINEIERILSYDVSEMVEIFSQRVPQYSFNARCQSLIPLKKEDRLNISRIRERNHELADKHTKELKKSLKTPYTIADGIEFVTNQVNRLLLKYDR